jgi:murein DD-endopeptidase MepM/ murein hydrolase activator NlpD
MQYDDYIDTFKRIINKQKIDHVSIDEETTYQGMEPDEEEMAIDSFMVINRTPQYLKESTLSFWKNQQLDLLKQCPSIHEWQEYSDPVAIKPIKKNRVKQLRQATISSLATPQWHAQRKRKPLTDINFCLPIEPSKFWISSFFGPRKKPSGIGSRKKKSGKWGFHSGIDMAAQRGTPVTAAAAGTVEQAGYHSGYGNNVVIIHDKVYKTRYAHLDAIHVKIGQKVTQHQKIGTVGDTGFTIKVGKDASHLHFELYEQGKQINPLAYLMA